MKEKRCPRNSNLKKEFQRCRTLFQCWPHEFKKRIFCSFSCRSKSQKRWKGKSIKASNGYKRIWTGSEYVPEHRYWMEKKIGRSLRRNEVVHHLNHDPSDNRIEDSKS